MYFPTSVPTKTVFLLERDLELEVKLSVRHEPHVAAAFKFQSGSLRAIELGPAEQIVNRDTV